MVATFKTRFAIRPFRGVVRLRLKNWKVKKGHESRIKSRHPWVFSNELLDSPKGILPGEPIELTDMQGHFLARGYGNPHSLIAFRAMSFSVRENFEMSPDFIQQRLLRAWGARDRGGFRTSFRLCFSEGDQMPGLILDRYIYVKNSVPYQVFSYQLLTAGMDRVFKKDNNWQLIFQNLAQQAVENDYSDIEWDRTLVLQRNDVSVRKLEGLSVEEPVILKTVDGESLTEIQLLMQNVIEGEPDISFSVNLIEGQKTGFFLDQSFNIKLVIQQLQKQKKYLQKKKKIKILDLCCYMGQWSAHIACHLQNWGLNCEVHLVDVSEMALTQAYKNVAQFGATVFQYKNDVLNLAAISELSSGEFDIVISDPPAFVKNKKDLAVGLAAYTKLNTQAFKLTSPGGLLVSCTCSGAVGLEDFKEALRKAALKSGNSAAHCLAYGGQGLDHPHLMSFPEAYYLKMILHQVGVQQQERAD